MAKKTKRAGGGILYSTDPDFVYPAGEDQEAETLPAGEQLLRVSLDTHHRKGKVVTLVTGFSGTGADLESLGKKLKTACGAGGSAKEGEILVQGDHLLQVRELLGSWGYRFR